METKKGAPPAADGAEFTVEIYDRLPPAAKAIREAVFVREQGFVQEFDESTFCCFFAANLRAPAAFGQKDRKRTSAAWR